MATVTYVGDEPREVSMLPSGTTRIVKPDEKFKVPDGVAESYACQPHYFEVEGYEPPADDPADEETGPPVDELVTAVTEEPTQPAEPVKPKGK